MRLQRDFERQRSTGRHGRHGKAVRSEAGVVLQRSDGIRVCSGALLGLQHWGRCDEGGRTALMLSRVGWYKCAAADEQHVGYTTGWTRA